MTTRSIDDFWRRLDARPMTEDIAALLVEELSGRLAGRRSIFLAVAPDTPTLVYRFGLGIEVARSERLSLVADTPLIGALLRGEVVALAAGELARGGLAAEDLVPLRAGLAVPLVGPMIGSAADPVWEPRCALGLTRSGPTHACWSEQVETPGVPERTERLGGLCAGCCAFGPLGVVVLEREVAFGPDDVEEARTLARVAGERAGALESVRRLDRVLARQIDDRAWLETMMVAAADPIVVTDTRNALVLQNRRAEDLLVAQPEDSPGRRRALSINDIAFSAYLSSFAIAPERAPRELALVDPLYGTDLLYEAISTPAFDATGRERIGTVTVLRDVTDLQKATAELHEQVYRSRRAEQEIRQERDRLGLIVQSAVEPIVVTTASNELLLTNAGGERLLQPGRDDAGPRQKAVLANDTRFSSYLTEIMATSEDRSRRELRLVDPDIGEERSFLVTSGKICDSRGVAIGVVSVLHDITELQELERRRLERRLFESEKLAATGRLAASIAHEVNNPLESIKNSLYLLRTRTPEASPARELTEVAMRECERVARIMKQFLGYYRPSEALALVDLREVLEEELRLVDGKASKRRIEVVRNLQPVPAVLGSQDQLKQVFLNLILNAIEAMPTGGTLTVATRHHTRPSILSAAAPFVCVTVADTGPGIEEEHLPTLFEPFFTTKEEKGTGLGLWVSHGIVKAHKGDIKVDTGGGVGTRFHVVLPIPG